MLHSQRALILLRMGDTSSAIEAFDVGIAMLSDPVSSGRPSATGAASTWPVGLGERGQPTSPGP